MQPLHSLPEWDCFSPVSHVANFSTKLDLALKALSMSRGRLAADLGVDKSLVGRWASGAVSPSEHSLSLLTQLIASKRPGFTMLDWDRDIEALAHVFGVELTAAMEPARPAPASPAALNLPFVEQARTTTARRGAAYEGFWRSTRPSVLMPGRFFHDCGMFRREADGLIFARMGGSGLMFEGYLLPAEGQLFAILYDTVGQTPIFVTLNGTPLPKAEALDGLVMAASLNPARTPAAYPIIFDRIGDLTGDRAADDAHCQALIARDNVAPEGSIPLEVSQHLLRDIGPLAAEHGGDLILVSQITSTFARGLAPGGQLRG
ncbi:MAG: hypothetical protein JWO33_1287 [Caulobacteraceae bacterium]|nr:hypothetical protein [Caulobacteraceae bacterium]